MSNHIIPQRKLPILGEQLAVNNLVPSDLSARSLNVRTTPTTVTEMIKTAMNQRIAQSKSRPLIPEALIAAQAGPDVTKFPGYKDLSPQAVASIEGLQRQGLVGRATGLLNLQEVFGKNVDRQLAEVKDIYAEQEESKRQAEYLKLAQRAETRAQIQDEYGRLHDAIEDERANKYLKLAKLAEDRAWSEDKYSRERDKIEDDYKNRRAKTGDEQFFVTEYNDLMKNGPKDEEGNLTREAREVADALLQKTGIMSPLDSGHITTGPNQITQTHTTPGAIDVVVKGGQGAPINAFIGGTVVKTHSGEVRGASGFGNYVKIRDYQGGIHTYAHLDQINVSEGDIITANKQIGTQGNTGNTRGKTGTHLHYQVNYNGKLANAEEYVKQYKQRAEAVIEKLNVPGAIKAFVPDALEEGFFARLRRRAQENLMPADVPVPSFDYGAISEAEEEQPTPTSITGIILEDYYQGIDPQATMDKLAKLYPDYIEKTARKLYKIYGEAYTPTSEKPLNETQVQTAAQVNVAINAIGRVEALLGADDDTTRNAINTLWSPTSEMGTEVGRLTSFIQYLLSGKTINNEEYARLQKLVPNVWDNFNPVEARRKIQILRDDLGHYVELLSIGRPQGMTPAQSQDVDTELMKYGIK